jgi:hypothetical protein
MIEITVTRPKRDENGNIIEGEIKYPVKVFGKFNNYAITYIFPRIKSPIDFPVGNVLRLMWSAYSGYCYAKQIEPDVTFEEMGDWLEENMSKQEFYSYFEQLNNDFKESKAYKDLIKKGALAAEEVEKKSLSQTRTYIPTSLEQSDVPQENII